MTPPPARPAKQRKLDTLNRLEHDEDVWVATASPEGGAPYLVPLSFLWDGATLLLSLIHIGTSRRPARRGWAWGRRGMW